MLHRRGPEVRTFERLNLTLAVEPFVLGHDDNVDVVIETYRSGRAATVDLTLLGAFDRDWGAAELHALVLDDGGFIWEVDRHVWLVAPPETEVPPADGPWRSGDRVPVRPITPGTEGSVALPLPHDNG